MYYLGVDLGGTNIKAALVDADGAIMKEASTPTKLPRPARPCAMILQPSAISWHRASR